MGAPELTRPKAIFVCSTRLFVARDGRAAMVMSILPSFFFLISPKISRHDGDSLLAGRLDEPLEMILGQADGGERNSSIM